MSFDLDTLTMTHELRHLRVLVRMSGLTFNQLPDKARDEIERTAGPDELARLVPALAGLSTMARGHLDATLSAAPGGLRLRGPGARRRRAHPTADHRPAPAQESAQGPT
jgi:hypothetical protein